MNVEGNRISISRAEKKIPWRPGRGEPGKGQEVPTSPGNPYGLAFMHFARRAGVQPQNLTGVLQGGGTLFLINNDVRWRPGLCGPVGF